MNNTEKNFDNIYRKNYQRIVNYINFKIHDEKIAEELADDVFIKFHNHFEKFIESDHDEKTYLFNITNSKIIDWTRNLQYIRKNNSVSIHSSFDGNEDYNSIEDSLVDVSRSPDGLMEDADIMNQITKLLSKIKNKKVRTVVELRYFDGLSYDEICEETGMTLSAVKVYIHRGLHELRDAISQTNLINVLV